MERLISLAGMGFLVVLILFGLVIHFMYAIVVRLKQPSQFCAHAHLVVLTWHPQTRAQIKPRLLELAPLRAKSHQVLSTRQNLNAAASADLRDGPMRGQL
jgi:hypothetical protein